MKDWLVLLVNIIARMVCASAENILDVIKQTDGVGKELYSHIVEFFSSDSVLNKLQLK